jgi:hypothetical protein
MLMTAPLLRRHIAPAILTVDRIDYLMRRYVIEYCLRILMR